MRLALFALSCLTLDAQNLTLEQQAALGKRLAEGVRRHTTPVQSQDVQNYVVHLGTKVMGQLPDPAFSFTFSIVLTGEDNALHEPLALPGGYIFVPSNLLLTANDEAEFVGMLAQAIAREPLLIKNKFGTTGTIPLIFLGGFGGDFVLSPAATIDQLREKELEADTSAILSMSRAGFDPAALLRYVERVQPPDRPRSRFPPRADRIAALQKAIRDLPPTSYSESDEFYAIQQQMRPLPPPPPTLFRKSDPPK
jgi:beta-barrel assembly-enhancing protease